jgi:putative transposase
MYTWRQLTPAQRDKMLRYRTQHHWPWHAPPHLDMQIALFHITAANFEHQSIIGKNVRRMGDFENELMNALAASDDKCLGWCVLPNHYHFLAEVTDLKQTIKNVGQLHGRTSRTWNLEDDRIGRQCWYRCADRAIRSERHMWAVMNYIHHNPVRHGYVEKWQDWPFSSAAMFIESVGRERTAVIWRDYPVLNFGKGWDDFEVPKSEVPV